ncbi:putative sensor histidine kinase/response regulator [Aspergillus clavatus NRRL 1]|uniref:Sensor histidine kinase/response regulator, putative n=1 Tax=Aspergillus clavatus (strain ATCC 1007 / CBS 513.65 / DSM 816 / NCTC 3887 / NRRL 1 / QM 1276 / 107) TaxID=344612 RepID=A1C9M9_ASPCL|nr:sensor histidine kinase/response regulator, putative [Aspergillus clavatus NRRL 1]EAW13553.1 sensor histidine kinase/response regulator, putative [Aspergillus clavatus NRRL 1]
MASSSGTSPTRQNTSDNPAAVTPGGVAGEECSAPRAEQPGLGRSMSFDSVDRVYPIRSVISVDPASAAPAQPQAPSNLNSPATGAREWSIITAETWDQLQSQPTTSTGDPALGQPPPPQPPPDAASPTSRVPEQTCPQSPSNASAAESVLSKKQEPDVDPDHGLVTARFRHVATDGGHAVITGRDNDGVFQSCEDEPIHIPGAVQSFGVLIVLREEPDGKLTVRVASENSETFLGYSPRSLFALPTFSDILDEDQADILLDHIDFVCEEGYDPSLDGPEVFLLAINLPAGKSRRFWCATHVNPSTNSKLIICELELEDDRINPLCVSGETTPMMPTDTLGVEPTPAQLEHSTINISQPLRVLRNARRRRGEAAAMEVFSILSQIQDQLGRAKTLDSLLNTTTGLVKELTGFHRVMIYQFDVNWNGTVVAELVDPKASVDLYKGLHFPASDIPKQARDLYRINKVRLLYDRDQLTSRLVCRTLDDLETPVDMTHAYLRAMSPIHVKYLGNMGVRASMSISITGFNELWGLISCHSYGAHGMRVSFPVRKICRLIGDTVSRNIERLSYASRLQARKLINTVPTDANPSGYIIATSDDLLKLFDADYGALSIRDETKILGKMTHSQEILALLEYLKMRQINSVVASHHVTKDFPDLFYPPGFKHISGMLYVPLSPGGTDFMVFFRRGHLTEIKWAGNPYEKKFTQGHLEPRKSFQTWRETVLDQSREWTESDVETAAVLCLVYGKFIKVWRQKEAAMENSQLTRLLLANSAHEVRTPLNAVINYLEIALEGSLDSETRDNLTKSYSASKSLIYVINDLLDLTNAEKGQNLIKDEMFDLPMTFQEAADMFAGEAKRKKIDYQVVVHPGLPTKAIGDQRRVRQVFTNLISNAVHHTKTGSVITEIWRSPEQSQPGSVLVQMIVTDTGSGMSQSTLESLFQELEQVSMEDDSQYFDPEDETSLPAPDGQEKRVLGLGLALVARIVRNLHGQLSVRSEEGQGSRFKISLNFPIPADGEAAPAKLESPLVPDAAVPAVGSRTEDEFLLVDGKSPRSDRRRHSLGSNRSGGSFNSSRSNRSNRSEADRLISAIQEPPLVHRTASEGTDRKVSKPVEHPPTSTTENRPATSTQSLPTLKATTSPQPSPPVQGLPLTGTARTTMPVTSPPLPGQEPVTDSGVPITALRISPQDVERPSSPSRGVLPGEQVSMPALLSPREPSSATAAETGLTTLRVLVAEDDPINSKIIQKRLEKVGHSVFLTGNGEECATAYRQGHSNFDVVLMDIQMPIIDGIESTRLIRQFEGEFPEGSLSDKASKNGRVPIFAVSASLLEKDADLYIRAGFDGWIMKPINFNRLGVLLDGLEKQDVRNAAAYRPGRWEIGGWFEPKPLL